MEHLFSLENCELDIVGQLGKNIRQPSTWFCNLETFWKYFGNGKGKCHIDVFCIFAKIAIVIMSKSCRIYSWNFLDKYGSTRSICFEISFEFGSREREWSIWGFGFLFFLLFSNFSFWFTFLLNANGMLMMLMTLIICTNNNN